MEPRTDRELLILLEQRIGQLSEAITKLGDGLKCLEEKKISVLQGEIDILKQWKSQVEGGWKLALLFWSIVTGLVIVGIKFMFKW